MSGVHFGALQPRPSAQVVLPEKDAPHFDADATAIDRLNLRGLITDSEAHRARQRLVRKMEAAVKATSAGDAA